MSISKFLSRFARLAPSAAAAILLSATMPATADQLTVVELFTSQGCNSCPPANENLAAISDRPDILALSYGVNYWDILGWKDTFATQEYTQRQYDYVRPLGNKGPYTPQIVINGGSDIVGNRLTPLKSLIARSGVAGPVDVSLHDGRATISAGEAPNGAADVWLVRYDPRLVNVAVGRGENGGRTLPHKNVVHDLKRLGSWNGSMATFTVPAVKNGMRSAVLVQVANGGPILAAAVD